MNFPVYNGTIFSSFFTDQNLTPIWNKDQVRSCDKNTMWWWSTFWANYRAEWKWSVVQESDKHHLNNDGQWERNEWLLYRHIRENDTGQTTSYLVCIKIASILNYQSRVLTHGGTLTITVKLFSFLKNLQRNRKTFLKNLQRNRKTKLKTECTKCSWTKSIFEKSFKGVAWVVCLFYGASQP